MNSPVIIGLGREAGSGKDTAADVLVADFGWTKVGFADELKRLVMRLWPLWGEDDLWGSSELRNVPRAEYGGLTPRKALQFIGTEIGRELDENVWVRKVEDAARLLLRGGHGYHRTIGVFTRHEAKPTPGICCPDTRFANELSLIRHMGGKAWLIDRPGAGLSGEAGQHLSETSLDGAAFDGVLVNDGTLAEFQDDVRAFARIAGLRQVHR